MYNIKINRFSIFISVKKLSLEWEELDINEMNSINNFLYKKIFSSFYDKLERNAVLVALDFNAKYDKKTYSLCSIDENYKIVKNDIENPLSGYSVSNLVAYRSRGEIIIMESELKKESIEKAFRDGLLYGLPFYIPNRDIKVNKALFLDRDGVLIEDLGYIGSVDKVVVKTEFIDIVKRANEKGYLVIVVTNQAGVAYDYYGEDDVNKVNEYIRKYYKRYGASIDDFYFCPYHINGKIKDYSVDSILRKPEAGMHLLAAKKYNINISESLMIGDRDGDLVKLPYLKSLLIKTENYEIINVKNIVDIKDIRSFLK